MLLLDDVAREILDAANVAHVVTRRKDGRPRVVVTWVARRGDRVGLNCRADRAWLADVRRDPEAVVTVVDLQDPYRYVTIDGRVSEATEVDALRDYEALGRKYWGLEATVPEGERVALTVEPHAVRVYHAVKRG